MESTQENSPGVALPGQVTNKRGERLLSVFDCITQPPPLSSLPQAPTGDEAVRLMRCAHDRYDDAVARRCFDEAARHEASYQAAFDIRKAALLRRARAVHRG